MEQVQVTTLEGAVSVSYRKRGTKWYATALQFDLVGIGKTREDALRELQEVFSSYVDAVLNSPGKVRFFNPSDASEWDNSTKEDYRVSVLLAVKRLQPSTQSLNVAELRRHKKQVRGIQLQPAV